MTIRAENVAACKQGTGMVFTTPSTSKRKRKEGKERREGGMEGEITGNAVTSHDTPPPVKPHLLPKQSHQLGTKQSSV